MLESRLGRGRRDAEKKRVALGRFHSNVPGEVKRRSVRFERERSTLPPPNAMVDLQDLYGLYVSI